MGNPTSIVISDPQDALRAMAGGEYVPGLPALNTAVIDTAAIQVGCSKRVIYVVVTTALTWVTTGQAKIQPYVGRQAMAAAGGATSQVDANHFLIGAQQNIGGASVTTLANQTFRIDPGAIAALAYPDPFLGLELVFPSALTGGVLAVYIESAT